MTHLLHDISLGETGETVNTFVEIPKGSMHKIEYRHETNLFALDRVEPDIFAKPVNYGFISQTWDEDNDPLDSLIITSEPLPTGVLVVARVIGVLNFVDGGENDHKIICIPDDDRNDGDTVNEITDLPEVLKEKLKHHFMHYKDLKKPGSTEVQGWGSKEDAWKIIEESNNRYLEKFKAN
ncbi:inorganic pyrophosphatase [Candidatus Woesebacteria bacterium GWC2_33_12]|uniref:Inorganic pyrophosphatase n=1 Tax=Candidatus Woesebacteria bacterium GW2011_GWB1_33_22 TaxID=1618566 RepID=A0A0G0CPE2_9BACT|nr:MAG: Inorganic pyrophosphatase [Candidatus Woesebacteria bacterium GW2011_GWC2_33_12]KKP42509.1 MAG: Inorganic pyrophosphatase [Candidatus Woesebacteria bacterium GW2011_GWA2_33_20]KKP45252.1 MAG: Inorganic pyrophosphatase [Candidatus Woesebacteria bacterium GW2011_GWB1_33_22]KKP46453.1 MAG: Inorganic pyrophosphatase [Microgenomates group bacterium GW2011_GWC1_33_28]KKP50922.1 MAG: Inorganic pyrophosphatase [Candidatus Woesebacteria bacterium GW2011_GWA1_33_33]OGM07142.1 MAG: inorganic pyro